MIIAVSETTSSSSPRFVRKTVAATPSISTPRRLWFSFTDGEPDLLAPHAPETLCRTASAGSSSQFFATDGIRQAIVHEIDTDAGDQKWVYGDAAPEVPIEWAIRVGEILYNLRSALDHLVWQLVLASGNEPTRTNQFPILDEEEEWTRARTVKSLKGVSDENKKIVRYLQPFNPFLQLPVDGQVRPCNAQVFRTLRDLCNIDKHRHLNLILAGTGGIGPIVFGVNHPPRRPTTRPLKGEGRKGEIKQDMVLLTVNDAEQELKPDFFIGVVFHRLEPQALTKTSVVDQLRDCLTAVQGGCTLFRQR